MKYGYARVSTALQEVDTQVAMLERLGVDPAYIVTEVISTRERNRPKLESLIAELRAGDELHVTKLDRLGRDFVELHEIARRIVELGVALFVGGTTHDTDSANGKAFFSMLAVHAELERDQIAERTRERLAHRKANGLKNGRKPALSPRKKKAVLEAWEKGFSKARIAKIYEVSRATVAKAITEQQDERAIEKDPEARRKLRALQSEEKAVLQLLEKAARATEKEEAASEKALG